ncbi:MAG: SMP-30/gluconolactonase/LRE family protein, partial [Planctomycetales bacterium]|nr:SMP-30/gluconolactonase/LRE family protein [Planctomycetales bacterium]
MTSPNAAAARQNRPATCAGPLARRAFLASGAAAVASTALARDYGENAPPVRYPDPDLVILD